MLAAVVAESAVEDRQAGLRLVPFCVRGRLGRLLEGSGFRMVRAGDWTARQEDECI